MGSLSMHDLWIGGGVNVQITFILDGLYVYLEQGDDQMMLILDNSQVFILIESESWF